MFPLSFVFPTFSFTFSSFSLSPWQFFPPDDTGFICNIYTPDIYQNVAISISQLFFVQWKLFLYGKHFHVEILKALTFKTLTNSLPVQNSTTY